MPGSGRVWIVVKSVVSYRVSPTPALLPTDNAPVQYLRVTLNWATIAFFVFSFLHCFTQGTIQSFLFSADDSYGALTSEIVARANISSTIFPQYTGRHGKYSLELCDQVPVLGGEPHPCDPFFTVGQPGPVVIPSRALPSDFKNVSSVRQLFLETFDFCLTLFLFVQSSGLLGQSQTNVVGLYTNIVPIPSHLSPDLTSLDRQWPRFFP